VEGRGTGVRRKEGVKGKGIYHEGEWRKNGKGGEGGKQKGEVVRGIRGSVQNRLIPTPPLDSYMYHVVFGWMAEMISVFQDSVIPNAMEERPSIF
jgi:hypothetical protein